MGNIAYDAAVAGVPTAANIPAIANIPALANFPGDVAAHIVPAAVDSAVDDIIASGGVPCHSLCCVWHPCCCCWPYFC